MKNELLNQANEKKVDNALLRFRTLSGALGGGARPLFLAPSHRRSEIVTKLIGVVMDMALAFHERDMRTKGESTIMHDVFVKLKSYEERASSALEEEKGKEEEHVHTGTDQTNTTQAPSSEIGLLVDVLNIEISKNSLGQPYQLERDQYLVNAKGRTVSLASSEDSVLTIGQKNTLLPQAYGDAKLTVKVAKKGDLPAQEFEINVTVKPKA